MVVYFICFLTTTIFMYIPHITISWISVGNICCTSTSFHFVSKLFDLKSKLLGSRFFYINFVRVKTYAKGNYFLQEIDDRV
jgi:hypothetical protein